MTSRLLAFVLALIIGTPACWCCLPVDQGKVATAVETSCCHQKKSGETPVSQKGDPCPCEGAQMKRDTASSLVQSQAPRVDWVPVDPYSWLLSYLFIDVPTVSEPALAEWTEPPRMVAGLPEYRKHCALLL